MYMVPDQAGRRIVVTGANSGTGKEATKRLAAAGAHVIMAVRSPPKGEEARADVLKSVPGARIEVRQIDLSDLASIRRFAEQLIAERAPLDTLVNNAGVMTPPNRETTKDGFELQWGSNFLGPFALTNLLLPLLLESPLPRIATMTSSAAHYAKINWDDSSFEKSYSKWSAYGQSKLADMVMGIRLGELARQREWKLISTLAHPGSTRTNLQTAGPNMGTGRRAMPLSMRIFPAMDVRQGTEPLLHAAAEPDASQGAYFGPRWFLVGDTHEVKLPTAAKKVDAPRLWELAERLTHVKTPLGRIS